MTGTSNARMLSIFEIKMDSLAWTVNVLPPHNYLFAIGMRWIVNWRVDIAPRTSSILEIPFEISKSSYGMYIPGLTGFSGSFGMSDSTTEIDSSISITGLVNLATYQITFNFATLLFNKIPYFPHKYYPNAINFDTFGNIGKYQKTFYTGGNPIRLVSDSLYDSKILFPPAIKNAVTQSQQPSSDLIKIFSHIGSEDHLISLEAEVPLGETTASLYSIDGRLLKEEKISMPAAGIYSFSVSGINARIGFLIVKTAKGILAKKVVF
jgi:hypothetical protein